MNPWDRGSDLCDKRKWSLYFQRNKLKSAELGQMVKGFWGKSGEGIQEENGQEISTYYIPDSVVGHVIASTQYSS